MRINTSFPGTIGTIASARRLMTSFLYNATASGTVVTEASVQGATLVASELVANAVKHTDGPVGMDLHIAALCGGYTVTPRAEGRQNTARLPLGTGGV
ncbi:hypothetical protein SAMN05216251_12826 [Actinacidiphila alni]|uniref:ATP-binding protein n=1 Tax=Actinacidiphila alni TaxID=380248 RepID=A0A1I2LDA4_9ACTN|nr:hypothetical protein [Actinacidiphila alni]SFF77003.1 hypothetical protein SAMN05216251_12826 [Actinacidiphila alni]